MICKLAIHGLRLLALTVILSACAPAQQLADHGTDLASRGDFAASLPVLEAAAKADPDNLAVRVQLARVRTGYVQQLLSQADASRSDGQEEVAVVLYKQVLTIDADNPRALAALQSVSANKRYTVQLDMARQALKVGHSDQAMGLVRTVLMEDPRNSAALTLKHQIDDADPLRGIPAGLRDGLKKQVTLEFYDANIKAVFEALSRSTGVNFVFDREVRPDLKVTVFLQKTSVEDAINVLTLTNQLEKKYLNDNTVLIYPNTAPKQKDYQELMVKTFYLANADAAKILLMLKTVLKTRDVYADEKLNSVTIRDTPAAIRLVENMINAQDLAEPEVTLDVEVLEVARSRLTTLGVDPPGQFTLLNIVPSPTQTVAANGTVVTNTNPVTTTSQLTVDNLKHFNAGNIGIPSPQVNIRSELGDSNLLANPRIRVKNKDKAHILIGDKVPVITTTSTANVGVSENVNYLDVGLQLDVEPNVYLNSEVGIKIGLEVSSIVKEVTTKSGTLTYQIGTRAASTELRLKDGETQALAGLINDQERHSAAGLPGFIDIPLLNRLFSTASDQHDKTEIVLLITPHIVRNITNADDTPLEFSAGTETASGTSALRLRVSSSMAGKPMGGATAGRGLQAAPVAEAPQSEPESAPPTDPVVPSTPQPAALENPAPGGLPPAGVRQPSNGASP